MKAKISLIVALLMVVYLVSAQTAPEPASSILENAFKQAATEKKNVMIIFHASWCGWCKKFEASISDPSCSEYFQKSFVIRELTVLESKDKKNLENPGAIDIFNKNGGEGGGIPFFIIYDSKGNILADSRMKPAGATADTKAVNMGCPASDDEVAAFVNILKKTSKINDKQISAITERFKKNKS